MSTHHPPQNGCYDKKAESVEEDLDVKVSPVTDIHCPTLNSCKDELTDSVEEAMGIKVFD